MSSDREELTNRIERERTDRAFEVERPIRNQGVGPRVIPLAVAVIVAVVLILLLFRSWGLREREERER